MEWHFALLFLLSTVTNAERIQGSTFILKTNLSHEEIQETEFTDIVTYMYTNSKPIYKENGKILAVTVPEKGKVFNPTTNNGFVDTILRAYNEHRRLVLRPDDIWLAITTAFGLYVNSHSEEMRYKFVDHKSKITLKVTSGGTLYSVNLDHLIEEMSKKIEENTKGYVRSWVEVNFSTSSKTTETVGRVVLMGILQNYFHYQLHFICGIPEVTLLGTLEDWQELHSKASFMKSFNVSDLNQWAAMLDVVLEEMVNSYSGNVNLDFWSHIVSEENWGSGGPDPTLTGWINVFIPFNEAGGNEIQSFQPAKNRWGRIHFNEVPQSTTAFPMYINDNGREYNTTFFGGHIVGMYVDEDDSVRPSLDWAIIDITRTDNMIDNNKPEDDTSSQVTYKWSDFPEPNKYRSVVLSLEQQQMNNGNSIGFYLYLQTILWFTVLCYQI